MKSSTKPKIGRGKRESTPVITLDDWIGSQVSTEVIFVSDAIRSESKSGGRRSYFRLCEELTPVDLGVSMYSVCKAVLARGHALGDHIDSDAKFRLVMPFMTVGYVRPKRQIIHDQATIPAKVILCSLSCALVPVTLLYVYLYSCMCFIC
jgi:hypothetical protein